MLQIQLKLLQKEQFKTQQKRLVVLLEIKLPIKLQECQKLYQRIIKINEEEILRERYISPELRQKIIDDLRLKEKSY